MTKQELLQALSDMIARGELSVSEVLQVAQPSAASAPAPTSTIEHHFTITKVLYAIGGIIVMAGLIFLLMEMWDAFSAAVQIFISLGSAIALYCAAVLLHQYERFRPIAALFFVIAGVVMPIGIFITLYHLSPGGNEWVGQLIMAGIPTIVYFLTFALFRQPILFFIALLFATWTLYAVVGLMLDETELGYELASEIWSYLTMIVGLAYGLIGFSFAESNSEQKNLTGPLYLLGSAGTLGAGFALTFLQDVWVVLYFIVILAAIYLSTVLRSRSILLFVAVALVAHLTHISFEYFANSLGWPLALILAGFMLIGVGYGTFYLNKKYLGKEAVSKLA